MKIIAIHQRLNVPTVVELTEQEAVVSEMFEDLLSQGLSIPEAIEALGAVLSRLPDGGRFTDYLSGAEVWA